MHIAFLLSICWHHPLLYSWNLDTSETICSLQHLLWKSVATHKLISYQNNTASVIRQILCWFSKNVYQRYWLRGIGMHRIKHIASGSATQTAVHTTRGNGTYEIDQFYFFIWLACNLCRTRKKLITLPSESRFQRAINPQHGPETDRLRPPPKNWWNSLFAEFQPRSTVSCSVLQEVIKLHISS